MNEVSPKWFIVPKSQMIDAYSSFLMPKTLCWLIQATYKNVICLVISAKMILKNEKRRLFSVSVGRPYFWRLLWKKGLSFWGTLSPRPPVNSCSAGILLRTPKKFCNYWGCLRNQIYWVPHYGGNVYSRRKKLTPNYFWLTPNFLNIQPCTRVLWWRHMTRI